MFTRFGGLSDARVKAQIVRGERIRALLTQPRFAALRLVDQVALLVGLADGVFDSLPVQAIEMVRDRVAAHLDAHARESVAAITKTGSLDDTAHGALAAAVRISPKRSRSTSSKNGMCDERKLSEVATRIGTVHQLEAVITATRQRGRPFARRADGWPVSAPMPRLIGGAIGEALAPRSGIRAAAAHT